jgi:hypothetical protein
MRQGAAGLVLQGSCALTDDVLQHSALQILCRLVPSVAIKNGAHTCTLLRKAEDWVA